MWYTSKGDDGETDLFGRGRVEKDDPRLEAVGTVDEATSCLGMARALTAREETAALLERVQRELILLMGELAAADPARLPARLEAPAVAALEADIDRLGAAHPFPRGFVLPGATRAGAALDIARAVVRRAERRVVTLQRPLETPNPLLRRYLNRLSSLLFLLARIEEA